MKFNKNTIFKIMEKELYQKHLKEKYQIYNEFSFQHELGIFLRKALGENYSVLFEKNKREFGIVKLKENNEFIKEKEEIEKSFSNELQKKEFCKKWNVTLREKPNEKRKFLYHDNLKHEIDISILDKNQNKICAIELKYLPLENNGYYASAWGIIRDIQFIEELKIKAGFQNTYCIIITDIPNIYEGNPRRGGELYRYFQNGNIITGNIPKINKKNEKVELVELEKEYEISWFPIPWLNDKMYCGIICEKE